MKEGDRVRVKGHSGYWDGSEGRVLRKPGWGGADWIVKLESGPQPTEACFSSRVLELIPPQPAKTTSPGSTTVVGQPGVFLISGAGTITIGKQDCTCTHNFLFKGCTCGAVKPYKARYL